MFHMEHWARAPAPVGQALRGAELCAKSGTDLTTYFSWTYAERMGSVPPCQEDWGWPTTPPHSHLGLNQASAEALCRREPGRVASGQKGKRLAPSRPAPRR